MNMNLTTIKKRKCRLCNKENNLDWLISPLLRSQSKRKIAQV